MLAQVFRSISLLRERQSMSKRVFTHLFGRRRGRRRARSATLRMARAERDLRGALTTYRLFSQT